MKDIKWSKETDLNYEGNKSIEKWKRYNGENFETFQMDVYLGKKTNLLGLKSDTSKKGVSRLHQSPWTLSF